MMPWIAILAAAVATLAAPAAAAELVDLALVLAVDVSGSMDPDEQRVQRQGYVAAFRHPDVAAAIGSGLYGRIAVTYMEWSGFDSQFALIPWRVLQSKADALAFAAELAAAPIKTGSRTSISGGLLFAASLLDQAEVTADRRTIDISGDGANNDGHPVLSARKMVLASGVTINGLPVTLKPSTYFSPQSGRIALDTYYEDCVIGGPGAFLVSVNSVGGFESAIRRKLVLEIATGQASVTPVAETIEVQVRRPVDCLIGERSRGGVR